jgi:hypothetical protein
MVVIDCLNRHGLSLWSYTLLTVPAHILWRDCAKWLIVKELDEVANMIPSHSIALELLDLFKVKILLSPLPKGDRLSFFL